MKTTLTASCLLAAMASAYELPSSNSFDPLTIVQDGEEMTVYVSTTASMDGASMVFPSNNRGTLLTQPEMAPDNFYKPKLLGGSISWDIDMSSAGCGCVNTLYLNSSPGLDPQGNPWDTDGQYYCDASATTGNFCPDLDLMEADMYAFQTKPHSCYEPNENGYYSECHQPGDCTLNSVQLLNEFAYGPGSEYQIDTTSKFNVKVDIGVDGTHSTILSQNGKSVSMDGDCAGNLKGPLSSGMNIVISAWSTMDNYIWYNACSPTTCTQ